MDTPSPSKPIFPVLSIEWSDFKPHSRTPVPVSIPRVPSETRAKQYYKTPASPEVVRLARKDARGFSPLTVKLQPGVRKNRKMGVRLPTVRLAIERVNVSMSHDSRVVRNSQKAAKTRDVSVDACTVLGPWLSHYPAHC